MLMITTCLLLLFTFTHTSKLNCYNQKCRGISIYNSTLIPCDNSSHKCRTNSTGYPVCEPGNHGDGYQGGVSCTGQYTCRTDSNSGEAYCSGSWQCYDMKCNGTGALQNNSVECNNKNHFCSHDNRGYPECAYTRYGGNGVSCRECGVDQYTGLAYCQPASRTVYYVWGGIMGGAAALAVVFYLAIKWVRSCDKKPGGMAETESLLPEKRDYRQRYGEKDWVPGRGAGTPGREESEHVYANV
ncbi:hypothetical protein ACHWQZ_G011856 [Mnemiopsis leidyi]